MKKSQAKIAEKIIAKELFKMKKRLGWDEMPFIEISQGTSKDWFGVEVRTDSDSYDQFYEDYENQQKVAKVINKKFKTQSNDHYFEKYGGGVLHIF